MGQLCQGFGAGKGQQCAWMAVWRPHVLLLSGEPCRMLQLLMHRVISQAGGITVLTVSKVISAVLGAMPAQLGVRNVLQLFLLGSRVLGRELQLVALEHPNAALALGSALPSVIIHLTSLLSPALTESQQNIWKGHKLSC